MARSIWSTGRCWGISTALDAARPSCIGWGPAWPWSVPLTTPGPPTWKPWGGAPGYSRAMFGGPMNSKPADTAGFSSLLTGRPEWERVWSLPQIYIFVTIKCISRQNSMIIGKVSQQRFWHCHKNRFAKTVPMIPHDI